MRIAYDLMAKNNPANQNILHVVKQESIKWSLRSGDC